MRKVQVLALAALFIAPIAMLAQGPGPVCPPGSKCCNPINPNCPALAPAPAPQVLWVNTTK